MSVSAISASNQNYLKAIWGLQEWSDEPVTATALAAKAGVRLSTASDAVRKLTGLGLIEHTPYGSIALTDDGRGYAIAMVRRHRLLETFLVETLGYSWDQVHDEADNLEHAVSDFLIDRIDEHLGSPDRDPHGDPIPRADGSLPSSRTVVLTDLVAGTPAVVDRVADEDPELLRFLTEQGIGIGTALTVREAAPFSGAIELLLTGRDAPLTLGSAATDAVRVRLLDGPSDE